MRDNDQPSSFRRILAPALLSASIWWIVPLILLIYPRGGEDQGIFGLFALGILALVTSSVVSAANRTKDWFVLFWMPPAGIAAMLSLRFIGQMIQEIKILPGSMAPLGGVAILIGMGALALLLSATLSLLFLRPLKFPRTLTVFALCNSIAIAFAASKTDYHANKQEVTIHILDFSGHPIQGATLNYERFGYGAGGERDPEGSGDPIISDVQGIVRPHLRAMRNELKGMIQHPQYQPVCFTVGMQYNKLDLTRQFICGTETRPNINYGSISVKEPLSGYIYMPPRYDTNDHNQILNEKISTTLVEGSDENSFLNVEKGHFGPSAGCQLRFELYFETVDQLESARLKVYALDGVGIQILPPNISFSEPIQYPERLFEIAPRDGYIKQITIMEPGSSPGPKLFISALNNTMFYMLTVDLDWDRKAKTGRCVVQIVKNLALHTESKRKIMSNQSLERTPLGLPVCIGSPSMVSLSSSRSTDAARPWNRGLWSHPRQNCIADRDPCISAFRWFWCCSNYR